MNKYLYEKIEQAHGAYFENIIFLANEFCRETQSELFEEFTDLEPIEIAKILGWNTKDSTLQLIKDSIEDKEFAGTLLQYDKTGFIAQCHIPTCSDFIIVEGKDRPSSWSVHYGVCQVFWIYADSIRELVHKLEKESEKRFLEMFQNYKEKKVLKNDKSE